MFRFWLFPFHTHTHARTLAPTHTYTGVRDTHTHLTCRPTSDLSPSRAFSTSGTTASPHRPVSRSFLCFLPRHSHHNQVVFNGTMVSLQSPVFSGVCLFFYILFLAPISSLDQRVGCFPFYVGYVTQPPCIFSRFSPFYPFQFFTSLLHFDLCFHMIPNTLLNHLWCAASNLFLFVTVMDHVSLPYSIVANPSD